MNIQQNTVSENNFEQCIKCTVCTVYCPVAAVNPLYPGPKQAGPDGERLRLKKPDYFDEALKYCLNCKRCEVACPSNVNIGDIIQSARIKYGPKRNRSLRNFILANTDLVGTFATPFSPIVNAIVGMAPAKYLMDKVLGIDHRRMFPKYSHGTFESWYRKNEKDRQSAFENKVSYFHGCYVNYNNPQLGKDLIRVMNHLGYGVLLLDKEKCCGVPLISNGLFRQASGNAATNIASIRNAVHAGRNIISTSSTCTFTIRDEYRHILKMDNTDIREHTELATRFITRLMRDKGLEFRFRNTGRRMKVAYHTPCHMEKMGWSNYSIDLLKSVPGLDLTILDSQCCGIAGTYGFKKENYGTSQAIGEPLFRQIRESGAEMVITDCETCKWQIEMSTGIRCENPITVIASMLED